ncbi:MAG: hypothetical protein WCP11_01580 [Candidatus Saccharibacteria bacterium]
MKIEDLRNKIKEDQLEGLTLEERFEAIGELAGLDINDIEKLKCAMETTRLCIITTSDKEAEEAWIQAATSPESRTKGLIDRYKAQDVMVYSIHKPGFIPPR